MATEWTVQNATGALGIGLEPFDPLALGYRVEGMQGYARLPGIIAVGPATFPFKVACHELAHVVLGHVHGMYYFKTLIQQVIEEAEAETTALICVLARGEEGAEEARDYLQLCETQWLPWDVEIEWGNGRFSKCREAARTILAAGICGTHHAL